MYSAERCHDELGRKTSMPARETLIIIGEFLYVYRYTYTVYVLFVILVGITNY